MSEDKLEFEPYFPSTLHQVHHGTVLNEQDQKSVAAEIAQRFVPSMFPEIELLADQVRALTPTQITQSEGVSYVLCERLDAERQAALPNEDLSFNRLPSTDSLEDRVQSFKNFFQALKRCERPARSFLYLAEPLPELVVEQQLAYFEDSLRPLMRDFLHRFAGSGEEMAGVLAGQFEHLRPDSLQEIVEREPQKACAGEYARLLYSARNFDSVFIRPDGATAWHSYETNEITQIASNFPGFLRHYAHLRTHTPVFDSWSSRKLLEAE